MQPDNYTQQKTHIMEGEQILKSLFPNGKPWPMVSQATTTYGREQLIYEINDPSDKVYMIAEGRVKIGFIEDESKNSIKSILAENDIFGEMALTGESARVDRAISLEDGTKIYHWSKSEMLDMMKEDVDLNRHVLHLLGARIRRTEKRLASLIHKDARTRIIDFLRDLAVEKGKKVGFETLIKNYFTHKDMASLTGTSRQTVTTVLNSLKEKNIINFDRRRILIRDMDLLI